MRNKYTQNAVSWVTSHFLTSLAGENTKNIVFVAVTSVLATFLLLLIIMAVICSVAVGLLTKRYRELYPSKKLKSPKVTMNRGEFLL